METDVPFGLPDTWEWVQLGQLAVDIHYGMTAKASTEKTEPAFVRITDIKHSDIQWSGVPGCIESDGATDKFLLTVGDILIARSGSVGVSTVVRDLPRPAVFASYLIRIVPTGNWLSAWWPVVAGSGHYWRQVKKSTTGSAQQNINGTNIRHWILPIPPIKEQWRIVEKVEDFMGLCDELEEQQATRAEARSALTAATLHRVSKAGQNDDLQSAAGAFADNIGLHLAPGEGDLAALKRIRQAILDLAVRGWLTHRDPDDAPATDLLTQIAVERDRLVKAMEIRKPKKFAPTEPGEVSFTLPEGWTWTRANEFFIASDSGWSPQCLIEQAGPGEWGVLKTSAVSRGVFEEAANKKLPPALEPRPQLEVHPGDFVMIRASGSKDLVGRGAIVTETESHLMLSDKHIRLSFLSEASTRYWAILNDSTEVQCYYSAKSSGTSTMSNVTRDRIGALAVPVPPLGEQARIAEAVEALFAICDDLEQQFLAAQDVRRDLGDSVAAHASW
ncbi:restriction endonuclease subunit S [Rhodococcus sp. BH5]|nr:restriction endonuclease subunit S [Rhodococcus sp. BH5]